MRAYELTIGTEFSCDGGCSWLVVCTEPKYLSQDPECLRLRFMAIPEGKTSLSDWVEIQLEDNEFVHQREPAKRSETRMMTTRVKVRTSHQLIKPNATGTGPIVERGEVLEVMGTSIERVLGKEYTYYLVEVEGERYISWPAFSEEVK